MSYVTRKPVSGVCDQVRHKLAYADIEGSLCLESLDTACLGVILYRQQTTKDADQTVQMHLCCSHLAQTAFVMTWFK